MAPLPFGCIEDWSRWLLITLLGALFVAFLWLGVPIARGARGNLAFGFACGYLLWLGIQILPMPPATLSALSPAAAKLYTLALPAPGGPDPRGYAFPAVRSSQIVSGPGPPWEMPALPPWRSISLHPYGTYQVLCQSAAMLCFIVMGASLFREPRQRRWLAWALVAAAGFQAAYGAVETLSGSQHIFSYQKRYYTDAATGTLVNRNHFAAMLNLAMPLALALMAGRPRAPELSPRFMPARARLRDLLGAASGPLLLTLAIVMGTAIVLSRSRMGIVAMLIGLTGFSLLQLGWRRRGTDGSPDLRGSPRFAAALPLLLVGIIGIYSFATDIGGLASRFKQLSYELSAPGVRPALWTETLPLVREYLVTGAGAGAYPFALNPRLKNLPVAGFWNYDHAHNDYLETAAAIGLVGCLTAAFALIAFCMVRPRDRLSLAAWAGLITLLVHSSSDFLLAIPSNALMACGILCLAGARGGGEPRDLGEAARAGAARARQALAFLILAGLVLWPVRSLAAAALFRPQWNRPATSPQAHRALSLACSLEPWNEFYPRTLAGGLRAAALDAPAPKIEIGEDLSAQMARRITGRLEALAPAHRLLLRSLALSPVDYELHAEIARSASDARDLARQSGIPVPGDAQAGSPLASPHLTSALLAPTAFANRVAMGRLLWKERAAIDADGRMQALALMRSGLGKPGVEQGWIERLVDATDDADSLVLLDGTLYPPSSAYANRLSNKAAILPPPARRCVQALRAQAMIREAEGVLGPLMKASSAGLRPEDRERVTRQREWLAALKGGVARSSGEPEPGPDPCGEAGPRVEEMARTIDALIELAARMLGER